MVNHLLSGTKKSIWPATFCFITSFFLLATSNLSHAQPEEIENLLIRDEVAKVLSRYNGCLAVEDFSCAFSVLEEAKGMDLSEYEQSRYWNNVAWVSFLEGDFEASVNANLRVAQYELLPINMRLYSLRSAAQLFASLERYQQAYETLLAWLELEGNKQTSFEERAGVSAREGDFLGAYETLESLVALRTGFEIQERHMSTESFWRNLGLYVGESSDMLLKIIQEPEPVTGVPDGFVELEFTVNKTGEVENINVVASSSVLLEESALEAARGLRYRPKVENREAVAAEGVRYRFEF